MAFCFIILKDVKEEKEYSHDQKDVTEEEELLKVSCVTKLINLTLALTQNLYKISQMCVYRSGIHNCNN